MAAFIAAGGPARLPAALRLPARAGALRAAQQDQRRQPGDGRDRGDDPRQATRAAVRRRGQRVAPARGRARAAARGPAPGYRRTPSSCGRCCWRWRSRDESHRWGRGGGARRPGARAVAARQRARPAGGAGGGQAGGRVGQCAARVDRVGRVGRGLGWGGWREGAGSGGLSQRSQPHTRSVVSLESALGRAIGARRHTRGIGEVECAVMSVTAPPRGSRRARRARARAQRRARPAPRDTTNGASRARTDDLCHAMAALSQLSYSPDESRTLRHQG